MINLDAHKALSDNEKLTLHILQQLAAQGVADFCVCAGARNAPFVTALAKQPHLHSYYWPEERSAAFFALGRIKASGRPVAVVTTSGTAAGELLPAAMEAHYCGLPLVLLTADRPRNYRGKGAPQSAEQVGLYGVYASHSVDIAKEEECQLEEWSRRGPLHLNVCLEEPLNDPFNPICNFNPFVPQKSLHTISKMFVSRKKN